MKKSILIVIIFSFILIHLKEGRAQTPQITNIEILNGDHINVNDPIYIRGYLSGNFGNNKFFIDDNDTEIYYHIKVIEDNSLIDNTVLEYTPRINFEEEGNPYTNSMKVLNYNFAYPDQD